MPIELRKTLQKRLFGGNNAAGNAKFYAFCLKNLPNICEECGKPLRYANASNVSHILTRGAFPEMAHDIRNINILCIEHHNQWEQSTTREGMKILSKNEQRIKELKCEYQVRDRL